MLGGDDSDFENTQAMGIFSSIQCNGVPGDGLDMLSIGGQNLFAGEGEGQGDMEAYYPPDGGNNLTLFSLSQLSGISGMSDDLYAQLQDSGESIGTLVNNQDLLNAREFVPVLPYDTGSGSQVLSQAVAVAVPGSSMMSRRVIDVVNVNNRPPVPLTLDELQSRMFPDQEIITTDNWTGPLKFTVTPESKDKKKAIYDVDMDKLFTNIDVTVPFKIEMDYGSIDADLSSFSVRANMIFLDNDKINEPVERCYKHAGEERKITDPVNYARLDHIMRPSIHEDVGYFRNETSRRCYLRMPVNSPEPGVEHTTRLLLFTCRNSCIPVSSSNSSTVKRGTGILFVLYNNQSGDVLGRRMIQLRICSAPKRDHGKERESLGLPPLSPRRRSAKRQSVGNGEDEGVPSQKRAHLNEEDSGSAAAAQPAVRCVLVGPPVDREETVSSSQESIISSYESDSKIAFKGLVRDMHWCLKLKNSPRQELREYSSHVFQSLKLIQGFCKSAKRIQGDLQPIKEETDERSPESGVGEGEDGPE